MGGWHGKTERKRGAGRECNRAFTESAEKSWCVGNGRQGCLLTRFQFMKSRVPAASVLFAMTVWAPMLWHPASARAADAYVPFDGGKSTSHGVFERFDYAMDEATLAISPFKAPEGEKFGVKDPAQGQRRRVVIVPKEAAPGQPWSWRGCYWDHQPQTEVELLRRGFHVAYISANATLSRAGSGTRGMSSSRKSTASRESPLSSA